MTIETTDGTLLGGRIRFRQPAAGYRSAIDPVFLAAAVPAGAGDRVFELGLGAGAAALCLLARVPDCMVAGVEPDPVLRRLALENAAANGLDGRLTAVADTAALDAAGRPFDHVMSNPPFWAEGSGNRSPDARKALANHESEMSIAGWVDELCRLCRPGGRPKATATTVYAAARLDDLLAALAARCGGPEILPLWPKAGRDAKRVLVRARIGGKGPARLLPGLTLHEADGRFTPAAEAVLRGGAPVEF
ncbi:MAG: methyltransferase [Rhodospirillaceae bacterium]|nr:methyltransferase [Rhodospirillaceae bacterium]MYH37226.1 methyltransferase [Rhodospirillaceae bacterium]MYK15302.1 methyltransferase [Rhodospirillaceae bacterium]